MALTTTDISVALLKSTLGISLNDVSAICQSDAINMWSKFKPTRGANGDNTFWKGSDGLCGFSLPMLQSDHNWGASNWAYIKPNSNYRMGDFRGYDHGNLLPPFYHKDSDLTGSTSLYPGGIWNAVGFYFQANSGTNSRPKPSDMGLGDYYVGMRVKYTGGNWYYKTGAQLKNISEGLSEGFINFDTSLLVIHGSPSFIDAPYGIGSAQWELFISDTSAINWTTAKPNTVYKFPSFTINGDTLINSGTITVSDWLYIGGETAFTWAENESGVENYKSVVVYTNAANWNYILPAGDWLRGVVYRGSTLVNNNFISGDVLRLYPKEVNTTEVHNGYVLLGWQSPYDEVVITVHQDLYVEGGMGCTINKTNPDFNCSSFTASGYPGGYSMVIAFTPSSLLDQYIGRTVYIDIYNNDINGTHIGSGSVSAKLNHAYNLTITLSEAIINGGTYAVVISLGI